MLDKDGFELFTRRKIDLQYRLIEVGEFRGSSEVELQMIFVESRLLEKIKQAILPRCCGNARAVYGAARVYR